MPDLQNTLDLARRLTASVGDGDWQQATVDADKLRAALVQTWTRAAPGDALARAAGQLVAAIREAHLPRAAWEQTDALEEAIGVYNTPVTGNAIDVAAMNTLRQTGEFMRQREQLRAAWADVAGALRVVADADTGTAAVDGTRLARAVLARLSPDKLFARDEVPAAAFVTAEILEQTYQQGADAARAELVAHPENLTDADGANVLAAYRAAAVAVEAQGMRDQLVDNMETLIEHLAAGQWLDLDGSPDGPFWREPTDGIEKRITWQLVRDRSADTVRRWLVQFIVQTAPSAPAPDRPTPEGVLPADSAPEV